MYVDRVHCGKILIDQPTWQQVEDTIRCMSQEEDEQNYLTLTSAVHASAMSIGGGTFHPDDTSEATESVYTCLVYVMRDEALQEDVEYTLINPASNTTDLIEIVVGDQASDWASDMVHSTDAILAVAEHFYHTGQMHPDHLWTIAAYL